MSVYNGGLFLPEALQSILDQTFSCLELIVINDGSTDNSGEVLESFQTSDNRVTVYHQENRGLIASLNRGCKLAKGKYIARMDADDVCDRRRLDSQVSFLEEHPEIGIVGSSVLIVDEPAAVVSHQTMPTHPKLIQWHLLFGNCFVHSSVMMRRDIVRALDYYRASALHAEDYDLWSRASAVTRLTNMPETLLKRREWGGNISKVHFTEQEHTACNISRSLMEGMLEHDVDLRTVQSARRLLGLRQPARSMGEVRSVAALVHDLSSAYQVKTSLDKDDSRELDGDVGLKFAIMALSALRISVTQGLGFIVDAVRLNPALLSMRALRRGLHKLYVGASAGVGNEQR